MLALSALLVAASVVAGMQESEGLTFVPFTGMSVLSRIPLKPQDFGDTGTIPPGMGDPAAGNVTSISQKYRIHKPAHPTSPKNGPTYNYPFSYTGSWSGGVGQGCPGGGAPRPRPYVIYNAASYGTPSSNMVALTFDDGPVPASSMPILSFLEQSHTPATFFVMGQYANAYPWLIQREAADGFAIGVHTWNHPDMQLLSVNARAYQLGATIQQLHLDLGNSFCVWLWRPPYGSVNSGIVTQAGAFGLTTVNWDVDPLDWSRPGTMVIVQRVLSQVRPGSIILLHDGPAARDQTAAALPYILAGLRDRGLVPVTLPTLLASESAATGPAPTPLPTVTPTPAATATAPAPTASPTTPVPTPTDTPIPTAVPVPTATP